MAIKRRTFLSGVAAALLMPKSVAFGQSVTARDKEELFAACRRGPNGKFSAAIFDDQGRDLVAVPLPGRGHDAAFRPGTNECVIFARRPGNFAVVINAKNAEPPRWFTAKDTRHFYGHGIFSPDGKLLFTTENDFENDRGIIGIRDATDAYKQIGEFSVDGIGPHDLALLSDGATAVIGVGGILTHPDMGRMKLNLSQMKPSLTYLDVRTGEIIEQVHLPTNLHKLSIRHLAVTKNDEVIFGCQYQGPKSDFPPLIGFHRRGETPELLTAPKSVHSRMKNYIGSVAVDRTDEIAAASSPRGDIITYWNIADRTYLGSQQLSDGCGISGTSTDREFLLTSGAGQIARHNLQNEATSEKKVGPTTNWAWDNHTTHFTVTT